MYFDSCDSARLAHLTADYKDKTYLAMPVSPPKSENDENKIIFEKYIFLCNYCHQPMERDLGAKTPWFKCDECRVQCSDTVANRMLKEDWKAVKNNSLQETKEIVKENLLPEPKPESKVELTDAATDVCCRCHGPVVQDTIDKTWFKCSKCETLLAAHFVKKLPKKEKTTYSCPECSATPMERDTKDEGWLYCPKCGAQVHEDYTEFFPAHPKRSG